MTIAMFNAMDLNTCGLKELILCSHAIVEGRIPMSEPRVREVYLALMQGAYTQRAQHA